MADGAISKLKQALNCDLTDYQSIPFWSWNNELDEAELVKQIEDMKSVGIGGFIMHARIGLKIEYLGEKWFSCIEACLKKARELHMNAWVYDENGWPSGFVGGKMLENEAWRAQFLRYEVRSELDPEAFCVYKETPAGYVRISSPEDSVKEYHCVYLGTSPANTDILNPEVVDEFIRQTHEEYYKRFPESFGRELVGFFTDEPQFYRYETPYTRAAVQPYFDLYGEDIRDGLIYLFLHDERGYSFRQRYYTLLNKLYAENFYKKLYDWCEAHNCKLTGHSISEDSLCGQMLGGAGVMSTYEYEHIPGIDKLGRDYTRDLAPKQIGSVASQLGFKQVLTETFACCGYDVTPKELKSVAECQYFNGVNLMCQHLFPYSLASQGKTDHPPVFSKHGNWWEGFKTFNDYFTRLGFLIANTEEVYDVLVVHPLREIYLEYTRAEDSLSVRDFEHEFKHFLLDLRNKGICYHLADETIMARHGRIEGDSLVIGNCKYNKVLLPNMRSISADTYKLLKEFSGQLYMAGSPTMIDGVNAEIDLASNITMEEICAETHVKFSCEDELSGITARRSELGDYLFIKNYSRNLDSHVHMEGVAEHYRALDLDTMTLHNISNDMVIEKCGGLVLVRDENAKDETPVEIREDITGKFKVTDVTENYFVIDQASLSYDGVNYGETLPIQRLFEDLLRADYRGPLYMKHRFVLADLVPMKILMEKEKYTSITVNGRSVSLSDSDFDVFFVEGDISDLLVIGENEIVYSLDYYQHKGVHFALFDPMATESLRNCLYYDTNVEQLYLYGDFVVDSDHVIRKREGLPALSSSNYQNGYPFFKGSVTLEGSYFYDGEKKCVISLEKGRFLMAELFINGKKTELVLDSKKDITQYLQKGENEIRILLKSSLRNLFGPYHWKETPEPVRLSPRYFTFRGTWNGGIAPEFTPEYQSVPFGVDAIEMIRS